MVFLETFVKGYLAVHLFLAIATFWGLLLGIYFLLVKKKSEWGIGNKIVLWSSVFYVLTWVFGLLIYPVFRVNVRAYNFDLNLKWATALFEIKEHVSSIGLFLALGLIVLSFYVLKDENIKKIYLQFLLFLFLITLLGGIVGVLLTSLHSV